MARSGRQVTHEPFPAIPVASRVAVNNAAVRESNRALVAAEVFSCGGGISRADVAARTGLTRATVSRLVRELLDQGILAESGPSDAGVAGRPATPLYPAAHTMVGVGIEVNADRMSGCAMDLTGEIAASFATDADLINSEPEAVLQLLAVRSRELMDAVNREGIQKVVGVTFGVPGIVDAATNTVVYAPNLGWRNVHPVPILQPIFGKSIAIRVDNDANLQALAAASAGADWPQSFLYLTGDVGIGGALMSGGLPDTGPHGWAGEIGHLTIEPNGPQCHCGSQGCLEKYAGKQAIRSAAGLPVASSSSTDLVDALTRGDDAVKAAVVRAGWALGIAIADVVNLLDLDTVMLGTSLAPLLPWLRPAIVTELDKRVIARSSRDITILAAPVDPFPTSKGGALMALQDVLENAV
ncbi:MAG: ROK family transcriptional regulator [Ancrocorticia sp.]|jgi:predicted NBD/HSP70 family sugar kinase|nr:ROK family transcriptional regulator [Ancrocorticia sp.]MCI1962595.1 ROK family transcriptional regulator [Ancrocorticia sp.]MCI2002476.1 ROK family transcriptional regulator [Ancrocorticia sp.]MCI2029362.1 ROK family transcriptional regulator [Ancrocorticia sp.]